MSYRFNDDDTLHSLKQQIQDNFISKNKDGNVVIDGDITAKDAYFNAESMHLGDFKISAPDRDEDEYYLKAVLSNELNKKSTWVSKATPALHVSTHYPTGTDPLLLNDDTLTAASDTLAPTQGNVKAYVDAKTVSVPIVFTTFDATPARNTETNYHGGLLALATGQALGPATPANDITVTKGIGKLLIVVNAGTDLAGTITITGTVVNRETGASGADTDTITVDAVTTDTSSTGGKAGGATIHAFSGAYISSKWFQGSVVLSTSTLNLSDVDVYHVSFEQFNDASNITLETLDANLFTTNANAEFDAYLYSIEVTGSKATIAVQASLHVGTDGFTAIANKYCRLRRGNINKALDGATDGIWIDVWYLNIANTYCQDVGIKVWASQEITLTS